MEIRPGIEIAINLLTARITTSVRGDDALKFTQAALNLAHALATHVETEKNR